MLRNHVKNLIAELLYRSGLSGLLIRGMFRNRAVVLTYHRVLPSVERASSFSHAAIMVEPAIFERHLVVLARYFDCLTLDELGARTLSGRRSAKPGCLITFDDAWQDNYVHAFGILKKWRVPAVVFVPTDYIGTERLFWQERLGHLVEQICSGKPAAAAHILRDYGWAHLAEIPLHQRRDTIKDSIRAIKHKTYDEIDRMIAKLTAVLDHVTPDHGPDRYLSVAQMREMMESGISFQSHGCSHRILPRLSAEELEQELRRSRHWLQEQLGSEPTALAYPNGDHDPAVLSGARRTGYSLAFTTVPGRVDGGSDPLALRRININDNAAGSEARLLMTLLLSGR